MKKWISGHKKVLLRIINVLLILALVALAVIVIVFGPVILKKIYEAKIEEGAVFDAGDIISYYGMIVAALVGVVGVYFSVYTSNKNYREDARNRVLPFISIDVVDQKLPDSFIQGFDSESFGESAADSSEKYYFIEPEDDVIIFAISKRGIAVLFELPEADMALLKNEEVIWRRGVKDGRMYIRGGEIVFLPMVIENIGNGIAHNFCFGLSKSNENPHFRTESVLKRGRPTKFVVFSKEKFEDIVGDYSFEVQYCDIVGNQYKQAFPLSIKTENNRKYESIDLEGKQYRIGKRTKKA